MIYADTPYTLEATRQIPADAPLSAGMGAERAAEVAAESAAYVGDGAVSLDTVVTGPTATVTVTHPAPAPGSEPPPGEDPEPLESGAAIHWNWGDGSDETGHDLVQGHDYARPGIYAITATFDYSLCDPPRPSLQRYTRAEIQTGTEPVEGRSDQVPDGTISEVLDWVGDDPERAQAALDAENERPTPRTSLIDQLEQRL